MGFKILSINPGATSTKVAIYEDKNPVIVEALRHSPDELKAYLKTLDQLDYRKNIVVKFLQKIDGLMIPG